MPAIEASNISHSYVFANRRTRSLRSVSLTVERGEFVAVIGRNGSGKSTLARHFNLLVPLQEGELIVAGLDASRPELAWEIRRHCGMVFQNPDNQFVSTVVEEDVLFGLENFEVPPEERTSRVTRALEQVEMAGFERRNPHTLSGGQKQRIALAGVLAVQPDVVILDEATTMLPPQGRADVMRIVGRLREEGETAVVAITHYIDEAAFADRVVVMSSGTIVGQGTPREVLTDEELLQAAGLEPPFAVRLHHDLLERGVDMGRCPLTVEEAVEQLCQLS